LRSYRAVGTTLSAGLDSSAVSAVAAEELGKTGTPLVALTSVPSGQWVGRSNTETIEDEGPATRAIAAQYPQIRQVFVPSTTVTPMEGLAIRRSTLRAPALGARNATWLPALFRVARRMDLGTLLIGYLGNTVSSWNGPAESLLGLVRRRRYGRVLRRVVPVLPPRFLFDLGRPSDVLRSPWRVLSPISDEFAKTLRLSPADFLRRRNAKESRLTRLRRLDNCSALGTACWCQAGARSGLTVRDPHGDRRLIEWVYGAPERLWQGPQSRWLFRAAMKGVLPDQIRLSARHGLQAADIRDRLRDTVGEVDAALASVDSSDLAHRYVDLGRCREVAVRLRSAPSTVSLRQVDGVLMRGLEVAMFLADLERGGPGPAEAADRPEPAAAALL
jgi:asparagine synthase (glutamine-hydrolysing)